MSRNTLIRSPHSGLTPSAWWVGCGRMRKFRGRFVMVQDDFLVEIAQVAHYSNNSLTFQRALIRASTSSRVL